MIRLETVEDFEKVRKALDDPASQPNQFCTKCIGYCTACQTLTEYVGSYSCEGCSQTCLRCKRFFTIKTSVAEYYWSNDEYRYFTWLDMDNIPAEFRKELYRLRSREFQRKVFRVKLNRYIKGLKSEGRRINNIVRRAAKLRG